MDAKQTALKTKITPVFDKARYDIANGADSDTRIDALKAEIKALLRVPNFDLTQYQLCLPVNKDGGADGLAVYVQPTPVLPVIAQTFVKQYPDSILVTCPHKGATTKSVHRARCEFQGLPAAEFTTDQPKRHIVKFAFRKPVDLPGMKTGDEIVFAQFHCGDFPMCKMKARLDATGFTIRAFVKHEAKEGAPDTAYTLAQAVPFDMVNELVMEWLPGGDPVPQHLLFTFNGLPVPPKAVPMDYPALTGIAPTFGVYHQQEFKAGEDVRYACVEFFQ